MFEILGVLFGSALMAILGWFTFLKPERLVGYEGSPKDLRKRIRHMKFCCVGFMICGGVTFILRLLSLVIRL